MANLFKNQTAPQISERARYEQRYRSARSSLLLAIVFTVINMGLLITKKFTYFLFSAYVPYFLTDLGMMMSGQYPADFYTGEYADAAVFGKNFFYVMLAVSIVILMVYLICWLFSKDIKVGWLIVALVFFCIDTVLMLFIAGINMEMIVDILFHGWMIFDLVSAVIAVNKLKKLPAEEEVTEEAVEVATEETDINE